MESEAKDGDEDNLQSAFKKLRVDAEGCTASLCGADGSSSRSCGRTSLEDTKPKVLGSLKESWHGSSRKTTRGAGRTPRRRRSKSPVLHPPKFTHCSTKTTCSSQLKHKSLCDPVEGGAAGSRPAVSDPSSTTISGYKRFGLEPSGASTPETTSQLGKTDSSILLEPSKNTKTSLPSDFHSVSKLGTAPKCTCKSSSDCQCDNWQNMEVYSFSGLRDMLTECEKTVKEDYSQSLQHRTQTAANGSSGSPRSCSEQARASVDDVTIEDLAGYMEYYLYIPKKMSHMAEMMYT
ncbi:oxidative stress-responsive serine-rich protein 1 [Hyla sarda]|uniref:oxidative stress-responsive serine-rich protein 1 n=1 Tax=Hyla sarda TaxID=327740 RepID=UPI0024C42096|nr:oxidative stress-responsive serine-rich protein 1 [Hyla sarda]XP_056403889.1 oxidative stress-responsive serine-rich protein 1 [Hyla sarda]